MTDPNLIQCPGCKAKLFDGKVVKGVSVLRLTDSGPFEGLCKRCKQWTILPIFHLPMMARPGSD